MSDTFREDIDKNENGLFEKAIGEDFETRRVDGKRYICLTCNGYIKRGKVPPMSNQNSLQLFNLEGYDELKLTELENSMIALNLIFQKIFRLPKSRNPAMKDRTVNIPIFQ